MRKNTPKLTFDPVESMDRTSLVNEVIQSRYALEKIRKQVRRERDFNRRLMKSLKERGDSTSHSYTGAYRADLALYAVKIHIPSRKK